MGIYSDWTLDELKGFRKALAAALASGHLRVRFSDREVTYRSLAEMRATLGQLARAIATREGVRPTRQIRADVSKGFCP